MWSEKGAAFFLILSVFLIIGNLVTIGFFGVVEFVLSDLLTILFVADMHGDYKSLIGFIYGFVWPLLLLMAYFIARSASMPLKYLKYRGVYFVVILAVMSVSTASVFHVWAVERNVDTQKKAQHYLQEQ